MRINETILLYEFIGGLDILGFFGIILITVSLLFLTAISIANGVKSLESKKVWFAASISVVFIVGSFILKKDADQRAIMLNMANQIKGELIDKNWSRIGFKSLYNELGVAYDSIALNKIIQKYPKEFIRIELLGEDSVGLKLIDPEATSRINKQLALLAPILKSQLIDHLQYNNLQFINYQQLLDLDSRYDQDLVEITLSMFHDELIPINLMDNGKLIKGLKLAKP